MNTKALRQKILDLAIRGKLVPQDPNDEPASVLLERIREQKKQMVKGGKLKAKGIKKDTIIFVGEDNLHYEKFADGSVKCIEDEIPFELPEGWAWARFQSITSILTDGTHKTPKYSDEGYIFLSSRNVTSGRIDWDNIMYIPETLHQELYTRLAPKLGDILLAKNGTTGVAAIVDREEVFDIYVSLALIRIVENIIDPCYVLRAIGSSYIQDYFDSSLKGIGVPNLHLEHIRKTLLPIPPYSEQNRIVSRADLLLPLVEQIANDEKELQRLVSASKSKILDLAIRGQLVSQNPDDEPTSVLLERIRAEKEELIRQGKIKRDKRESIIFKGEDNSYYQQTGTLVENLDDWDLDNIPDNWELCCLGELCDYGNCTNVDTKNIADEAWILDLEDIEKDSGRIIQKIRKFERESSSTKHLFHKGQVLYSKLRPYLNKVVIADEDGFCTSEILPLDFSDIVDPQYALYYLMSPTFLKYANSCSYGVKMPRLGTADGKKAVFPLPPLDEQKRIAQQVSNILVKMDIISNALL